MDRIKVGVAGAGRHGSRYIDHILNDIPEMELTGVTRSDPSLELEKRWVEKKVRSFGDQEGLLIRGIDLLIIATPTDTHHELALKGLKAGVHVLLEKPMCGNSDQCRDLILAEKESEGSLTIAQTLRYSPTMIELDKILKDKGPVRWFEAVNALEPPKTPWLMEDRAMGGCVLNTGVHVFDLIEHLLGKVVSTSCWTERILNPVWEDYAYGNLTLSDGLEGAFRISRNTNQRTRYLRVDLDEGFIWADTLTDTIYNVNNGKMKKRRVKRERNTLIPLLSDMVKVIRGEIDPPISGTDGLKAVTIAESCYSSAMEDKETRLKSE